ncbi:D-alanyl-D-alanine carboxypeptidase [Ruminococcaceae bacterium FB2012]|nr:D-alanyl-D-alanine carboxypeptidase [Ruminococcaceae bacterium FB2012]
MSVNSGRKYKYKNIALALAIILLCVLALGSSCSKEEKEVFDKNVPEIFKPVTSHTAPQVEIVPFKAEGLEKNFRYLNVRNGETVGMGDLLLLNQAYKFDGVPGDLVSCYEYLFDKTGTQIASSTSTLTRASKRVLQAFNEMVCAFYAKTGKATIMLTDLYLENDGDGKPCYEHESGLAIDLRLYFEAEKTFPEFTGTGEYSWFADNCYKYGFILRYPAEKAAVTGVQGIANHFRYVGKPHAEIMKKNKLCLEEYLDMLKQYKIDSPYSYEAEDGSCWAIYYFEQSTEPTTNIPIPLDKTDTEYTHSISGDNRDGYIITVNIPQ